jgi:dTDP-4-dehydrorhamnose 3,5-epimerase
MHFTPGIVAGVVWKELSKYHDRRGWLCELFRQDELDKQFVPVMAYASVTEPGITRGPHEHVDQADYFCFFGPSDFKLYLWDTRPFSRSRGIVQVEIIGASRPTAVIVPPGVVHAYRNVGDVPGLVFNCPNRLYKGWGKSDPVDEIRHEDIVNSPFVMDDELRSARSA